MYGGKGSLQLMTRKNKKNIDLKKIMYMLKENLRYYFRVNLILTAR